jgi:hypothetical protein
VVNIDPVVGRVIVTVGGVASSAIPTPVTGREILSPSEEKVTLAVEVAADVGENRTVTSAVPEPGIENGLPDTMRNGPEADAVPETLAVRVFCTVKTRSAEPPTFTLPKLTVPAGVTDSAGEAVALATSEQAL